MSCRNCSAGIIVWCHTPAIRHLNRLTIASSAVVIGVDLCQCPVAVSVVFQYRGTDHRWRWSGGRRLRRWYWWWWRWLKVWGCWGARSKECFFEFAILDRTPSGSCVPACCCVKPIVATPMTSTLVIALSDVIEDRAVHLIESWTDVSHRTLTLAEPCLIDQGDNCCKHRS